MREQLHALITGQKELAAGLATIAIHLTKAAQEISTQASIATGNINKLTDLLVKFEQDDAGDPAIYANRNSI